MLTYLIHNKLLKKKDEITPTFKGVATISPIDIRHSSSNISGLHLSSGSENV